MTPNSVNKRLPSSLYYNEHELSSSGNSNNNFGERNLSRSGE